MNLYKDKECTELYERIDLGRLPVGEKTSVTVYLKNESKEWPITKIHLNESDPEVKVDFPQILRPSEIYPLNIEFHPNINRRKPLDVKHLFTGELYIG